VNTTELEAARKQLADIEAAILSDITEKATALGYTLVKDSTDKSPAPEGQKVRRKRRTRAEMEAARAATIT
jgi:hypothetical protein